MFDSFLSGNGLILLGISLGFTLLVAFSVVMGVRAIQNGKGKKSYQEQLDDLLSDDFAGDEQKNSNNIFGRWFTMWGELLDQLGWERYGADNPNKAGKDVAIVAVVIAVIGSGVTLNFFVGPVIAALALVGFYIIAKNIAQKKADSISDQLPGFIFAVRANIQANETPERAVLKVIDAMPSPLYEDLLVVKRHILSNSTFKESLEDLKLQTANRDLKFLASCMIQATDSGANLETQLETIQNVLKDRREVSDEINQASRSAAPAIWVSAIAIPGTFFAIFFVDPNASSFWFVQPVSWGVLLAISGLWGLGVFLSRRMVSSIRNI